MTDQTDTKHTDKPLTDIAFSNFDLHPAVLAGLESAGFTRCTPIQALTLPIALAEGPSPVLNESDQGVAVNVSLASARAARVLAGPRAGAWTAVLTAAGYDWSHVHEATLYVTDVSHAAAARAAVAPQHPAAVAPLQRSVAARLRVGGAAVGLGGRPDTDGSTARRRLPPHGRRLQLRRRPLRGRAHAADRASRPTG